MTARSVAAAFADATSRLTGHADTAGSLVALLGDCVALLEAESAGLLIRVPHDGLAILSSTSHEATLLDLYELQSAQGPCIDAIEQNSVVRASVPRLSDQWTPVGRAMVEAGYTSVHAFPLRYDERAVGALNVFTTNGCSLDTEREGIAQAFANLAVAVLAQPRAREWTTVQQQIVDLLAERSTIEQAKGVLAVKHGIGLAEAYALLVASAVERRTSLASHAASVVASVHCH